MLAPAALLALLCSCALLLFGDRGVVSCNNVNGDESTGIQHAFSLSLSQLGFVYAALMVGLSLSAPLAAQLNRRWNALRLIGCGVALAAVGALGCGLAPTFTALLLSRALIGAGCGPVIALSSPLIDDIAPPRRKSLFLAALFLCIPLGFALGYIWGSLVAAALGWRASFFVEAAMMAPPAALCLLAPHPADVRRSKPALPASPCDEVGAPRQRQGAHGVPTFFRDILQLAARPVVVLAMLGAAAFNGSLGGFSFYGPKAARAILALDSGTADVMFGLATVVTGVVGTLGGGLLLDSMGPSVRSALLLCMLGLAVAAVAILAAFGASRGLPQFCAALVLGEGAMFMTAAPANAALLWSVPPDLRPAVLSMSEVMSHALGDVPLPPLLGLLQQHLGSWRLTMSVCTGFLALAALLFACARCMVGDAGEGLVVLGDEGSLERIEPASGLASAQEEARAHVTQPLLPAGAAA